MKIVTSQNYDPTTMLSQNFEPISSLS